MGRKGARESGGTRRRRRLWWWHVCLCVDFVCVFVCARARGVAAAAAAGPCSACEKPRPLPCLGCVAQHLPAAEQVLAAVAVDYDLVHVIMLVVAAAVRHGCTATRAWRSAQRRVQALSPWLG